MILRVARHTHLLQPLIDFYTQFLGLQVLGSFEDHDTYDGVFLGIPGENWHLEFTVSEEAPQHVADADDLLVFYAKNEVEYQAFISKAAAMNIPELPAKNPYWTVHGKAFADPDGFSIVISIK